MTFFFTCKDTEVKKIYMNTLLISTTGPLFKTRSLYFSYIKLKGHMQVICVFPIFCGKLSQHQCLDIYEMRKENHKHVQNLRKGQKA